MILCVSLLFLCSLHMGHCWTTEDLELFDLVESTPQTFYQVLGVDEKASASDIRKAYRKLSTTLHPDKNKNDNAEEEFRRVAAVADVLRNEERRKAYDYILKVGLPDWRAPIYYYRHVRNMGLFEMTIFLFCLATLGQYIFAWTAYWEKKYEIEEVVLSKIRKKSKHQRKGNSAKLDEEIIVSEAMSILQKPKYQDLFPIRLFYFMIHIIKSSPSYIASCKIHFKLRKEAPKEEEVEEVPAPRVKTRKIVGKPKIPDYTNIATYDNDHAMSNGSALSNGIHETQNNKDKKWSANTLTEQNILEFKKALKKFPNGTLERWEKVSSYLGCSVSEVVSTVKKMKSNQFSKAVPLSMQGVTGTEKENFGCELYSEKDAVNGFDHHSKKNGLNNASEKIYVEENIPLQGTAVSVEEMNGTAASTEENAGSEKFWKQEEQRSLEVALQKFPKDTPSRWEKISEFVSTKTKEACVARYKILVQQVKKKKGKGL